jgi:hypothetical protein
MAEDTYGIMEEDQLPSGYMEALGKFRILVSLLNSTKNVNDVQFLVLLSSDINLFRLYMQYTELDLVFDAVRYLFLAFPAATKSKKVKTTFCQNLNRIKNRIMSKM